jgi:hypothetical protein
MQLIALKSLKNCSELNEIDAPNNLLQKTFCLLTKMIYFYLKF